MVILYIIRSDSDVHGASIIFYVTVFCGCLCNVFLSPLFSCLRLCRMKDTSRKNNMFAQFRKNERDKQKLIDTVVKQLRNLIASHQSWGCVWTDSVLCEFHHQSLSVTASTPHWWLLGQLLCNRASLTRQMELTGIYKRVFQTNYQFCPKRSSAVNPLV